MKSESTAEAMSCYGEQLDRLSAPGTWIAATIDEAGAQRGWWQTGRRWRRSFGRFDPRKRRYCSLLYETEDLPQALCVIEAFTTRPAVSTSDELCVTDNVLGWLRLTRFPRDPELTTLPAVLSDAGDAHVLRYRPRKRCTLRVEDSATGQTRFAKVFPDGRGEAIAQTTEKLWYSAELQFNVAKPYGWDATTRTHWQGSVAGTPVIPQLLDHGDAALAARMGRACASITHARVKPAFELGAQAQLKRTARYGDELSWRVPALAPAVTGLLADLTRAHARAADNPHCPIHGAPHAHQWLDTGSRLGLVDFDRFCLGDPELDVATFVAEMDFEITSRVPVDDLNHAFIAGYESAAGRLDRSLLQAYRTHKYIAKALKAARAVRLDGRERAALVLSRARACLAETMP